MLWDEREMGTSSLHLTMEGRLLVEILKHLLA
jgi:hypothetical protein